ncbi:MAG: hypothetical protein ACKO5K_06085, partial [Armatimonadota bacterium]
MKIEFDSLSISHMFERPFSLALGTIGPRVTAIYADNGEGKTTLAAAYGILLNPDHSKVRRSDEVGARMRVDGRAQDIRVLGKRTGVDWPCSPRPNLYHLGIEDLIAAKDTADRDVLLKALSGGVDLAKVLRVDSSRPPVLKDLRAKFE